MILDDIISHKRREVGEAKGKESLEAMRRRVATREAGRFCEVLSAADHVCLIAEVKKASPSRGVLCARGLYVVDARPRGSSTERRTTVSRGAPPRRAVASPSRISPRSL